MAKSPFLAEYKAKLLTYLVGYNGKDPLKTLSLYRDCLKTELGQAVVSADGIMVQCIRASLENQPVAVTMCVYGYDVDKIYNTFVKFHTCSPGIVPEPYDFSSQYRLVFFEDLLSSESLQQQFDGCLVEKAALQHLGEHIATIHSANHLAKMSPQQFAQLEKDYGKSTTSQPYEHEEQYPVLTELRSRKECLIHGSLNPNCILIKDYEPKMVGLEKIHVGSCATDPASILAFLILEYHRHMLNPEENDKHRQVSYKLVDAAKMFGERYLEKMKTSLGDELTNNLISEMAILCGAILLKMMSLGQYNLPAGLHEEVTQSAQRLLRAHQRITSTDRLLVIALMLT